MSKEMRLMRAIGDIDDRYIDEAAPVGNTRAIRSSEWVRYAGAAAAAVLVIGAGLFVMTRSTEVGVNEPLQTTAAPEQTSAITDMPLEMAGNPYAEYDTLEEAAAVVGFDISVPESFGIYTDRHIATIFDDMTEVTYYDEKGTEGFSIRKTVGSDDPSGDCNIYDNTVTADIGGRNVIMSGNGGRISKAVWTDGKYAYSVSAIENGLSRSEIEEIISSVG